MNGIHLQTNCTGTVYIYKQILQLRYTFINKFTGRVYIYKEIVHERYTFINELAEGPGIDRGKKN